MTQGYESVDPPSKLIIMPRRNSVQVDIHTQAAKQADSCLVIHFNIPSTAQGHLRMIKCCHKQMHTSERHFLQWNLQNQFSWTKLMYRQVDREMDSPFFFFLFFMGT